MKPIVRSFFLSLGICTLFILDVSSAFAGGGTANLKNFYCSDIPQPLALSPQLVKNKSNRKNPIVLAQNGFAYYSPVATKDCGKDKKESESDGLCMMMTKCVYITPEIDAVVKKRFKKSFHDLSTDQKTNYLVRNHSRDAMDAFLTCRPNFFGSSDRKKVRMECPTPDECKGDSLYNLRIAPVSPERTEAAISDQQVFQPDADSAR